MTPRAGTWLVTLLLSVLLVLPLPPAGAAVPPFGNSLRLDGVNDYANISDNSTLDLGDTDGEDFTVEAFIYVPDQTGEAVQVIAYKQYAYRLSINFNTATPDVLILGVWGAPIGSGDQLLNSAEVTTGWHHIAGVFDNEQTAAHDLLAIYLDGTRVALADSSVDYSPGIYNSTNLLSIGANSGAAAFNGWLDEVRLSDVVRYSGATVPVPSGAFGTDGNSRALWHFDEAACATTFADASGNNNTLTGQNGAQTGLQGAAAPSLQLSGPTFSADEGAGSAAVTVTRSGDPAPVVGATVSTTSGGTATAGEDYTEIDEAVSLGCGETQKEVSIPLSDDTVDETDETVALSIGTPTGGASLGSPTSATLTIGDNDGPSMTIGDASIGEGDTGTVSVTFTVTLSTTSPETVSAGFTTVNGSATSPEDYSAATGSVSFASGETSRPIEVEVVGDTVDEPDETFTVQLGSPIGGTIQDGVGVATVGDDDEPPPGLQFQSASQTVTEAAGTVAVIVRRTGPTDQQVQVSYARTAGTATPGSDFTLAAGTLTFPPGDTAETIPVPVSNDAAPEGSETVVLTLSSPVGAVLQPPSSSTVRIAASDQRPDGLISRSSGSGYVGNDVYNTTGANQTRTATARRTQARNFYARIFNDGQVKNTFTIRGSDDPSRAVVRYFVGSTNVTTTMRSAGGLKATLVPGAYRLIRIQITVGSQAAIGSRKAALVAGMWSGDSIRTDVVKAVVEVSP